MKIDMCLISSDLNELYYGLFPYVKKAWNENLDIPIKLILIANSIPNELKDYSDDIILFKPIENIHTAYTAQTIRLLYPAMFPNKNIIISDMDIIPLSRKYFIESVKNIENKFIIYRDAYIKQNMYAMCYCLGKSEDWAKIFNINCVGDIIDTLKKWYNTSFTGIKNCDGWFTDQEQLFKNVNKNYVDFVILKDKELNFKRLDKKEKKYIIENLNQVYTDITNKKYTDFHVIRPYYKYNNIINNIIQRSKD